MSFSLHTIRKFQKPLIFGLAVFLIAAFGIPWSQLFRQGAQRTDEVYMTIRGRDVTVSEMRDFVLRWAKVNPRLADEYENLLYEHLKRQMVLIDEARRAGLSVSDFEVRKAASLHGYLLRSALVEIARAMRIKKITRFRTAKGIKNSNRYEVISKRS